MVEREHGVKIVRFSGQRDALFSSIHIQQRPQRKEEQIDYNQHHREPEHILLGLADIFAGKVLLHQILIHACHHYGNESPGNKLFEEILGIVGVPVEYFGIVAFPHRRNHLGKARQIQLAGYQYDGQYDGSNQEGSLQSIRNDNRFDTAFEGINPD